MVILHAKVKCDHWDCLATEDVVLELQVSREHKIPTLEMQSLPDGWAYPGPWQDGEHYCPAHKSNR